MVILGPDSDTSAAADIADYLAAVTGGAQGWVCVGVGIGPFRTVSGRFKFKPLPMLSPISSA